MLSQLVEKLRCAECRRENLTLSIFEQNDHGGNGAVHCRDCRAWFPVEDGILDFLPKGLGYPEDRQAFWNRYADSMKNLGLSPDAAGSATDFQLQRHQQEHFDWYADNSTQSYTDYADTPFWIASDSIALDPCKKEMRAGNWFLDVGCAQGRSTFRFMDLDINIVGFDVSKKMVQLSSAKYRAGQYRAKAIFLVADANAFPFKAESFDNVLIFGVLHHLPNPTQTCREVARVLKPGGIYFGQENNQTAFRFVFDWLQKAFPIWHEEAGPESMISKPMLRRAFEGTGVQVRTKTVVFLLPHLVNKLSKAGALTALQFTDSFFGSLPFFRNNGGIILIRAEKLNTAAVNAVSFSARKSTSQTPELAAAGHSS